MRCRFFVAGASAWLLMAALAAALVYAEESAAPANAFSHRLYIGTLADVGGRGIYQADFNSASGKLQMVGLAAEIKNASFLAIHPSRKYLYATCDVDEYEASQRGAVAAFAIDTVTGKLKLLNHQSSQGGVPCHVSLDREGKFAFIANYLGGNAAVLPIAPDGTLRPATSTVQHHGSGMHPVRQQGPHPHSIILDLANCFAFVADAGTDQIRIYRFDTTAAALTPHEPAALTAAAGAAPRHLAFHPIGKWAYVINELNSTVTAMHYDSKDGVLSEIQAVSTRPKNSTVDNLTAEIVVHPSGNFLYGSNRGDDSIAMFQIDQHTGRLTSIGQQPSGGRTPRSFVMDPGGKFLLVANQDSNNIVVYGIDSETGQLTRTANEIAVPGPLCIETIP